MTESIIEAVDALLEAPEDKVFKKKCAVSKGLERTGDCYAEAANAQALSPKYRSWLLVHGRPTLQRAPFVEYGHAWLEKGDGVYDPSTNSFMPKLMYYALGQIDYRKNLVYTAAEAREFMVLTRHYGPWEGPEGTPATSRQKKEYAAKPPRRSKKGTPPKTFDELRKSLKAK